MTDVQAAMLYDQIKNIKKITLQRKKIYGYYIKYINKYSLHKKVYYNNIESDKNYHCIYIIFKKNIREKAIKYFRNNNIETYVGYSPLHNSIFFRKIKKINLKKTEFLSKRVLRLPMHNYLNENQVKYICKNLNLFLKNDVNSS